MNIFFFKQKTAYEMRISDWSSDVCSSDLPDRYGRLAGQDAHLVPYGRTVGMESSDHSPRSRSYCAHVEAAPPRPASCSRRWRPPPAIASGTIRRYRCNHGRSEERTSEFQSLMRNSYAVLRL